MINFLAEHEIPFVYFEEFNWVHRLITEPADIVTANLVTERIERGLPMSPLRTDENQNPISDESESSGESSDEDPLDGISVVPLTSVKLNILTGPSAEDQVVSTSVSELPGPSAPAAVFVGQSANRMTQSSVSLPPPTLVRARFVRRKRVFVDEDSDSEIENEGQADIELPTCSICITRVAKFMHKRCGHMAYCRACMVRTRRHNFHAKKRKIACPLCRASSECIAVKY